jgi:hypothetical protein
MKKKWSLAEKYPPSEPCSCAICRAYCARPGWWTVEEARRAIEAGYGARMMLEVAPEWTHYVLAPAFRGCEGSVALQIFARNGCCFLKDGLCELHMTSHMPLECRFCHHARPGLGEKCHADIEKDWTTARGQALVAQWMRAFAARPGLTHEL